MSKSVPFDVILKEANNMSKEFPIRNQVVLIDDNLDKINEIISEFHRLSLECVNDFTAEYREIKNLDKLVNSLQEMSLKQLYKCVEKAIDILTMYNIWDFSSDRFIGEYYNEFFSLDNAFDTYIEKYREILVKQGELDIDRNLDSALRPRWEGGGFGLGGAIKGAINASILNFATDIIYDAVESYSEDQDSIEIKNLKSKMLKDESILEQYSNSLQTSCEGIGWALCHKLNNDSLINGYDFDADSALAVFDNISKRNIGADEKLKKLLDCITKFPYEFAFYEGLFELAGHDNKSVVEIAKYFGFDYEIQISFLTPILKDFDAIEKMQEKTPNDMGQKLNKYFDVCKKYNLLDSKNQWNEELINNLGIGYFKAEFSDITSKLEKKALIVNGTKYNTINQAQTAYDDIIQEKKAAYRRKQNAETFWKTLKYVIVITIVILFFKNFTKIKNKVINKINKQIEYTDEVYDR